jgi:hypothetical protein
MKANREEKKGREPIGRKAAKISGMTIEITIIVEARLKNIPAVSERE